MPQFIKCITNVDDPIYVNVSHVTSVSVDNDGPTLWYVRITTTNGAVFFAASGLSSEETAHTIARDLVSRFGYV